MASKSGLGKRRTRSDGSGSSRRARSSSVGKMAKVPSGKEEERSAIGSVQADRRATGAVEGGVERQEDVQADDTRPTARVARLLRGDGGPDPSVTGGSDDGGPTLSREPGLEAKSQHLEERIEEIKQEEKKREPRRRRWLVIGLIGVLGLALFAWDENRDDQRAEAQRRHTVAAARDARAAARAADASLNALIDALAKAPANTQKAIDEISRRFEEAQERQTSTIRTEIRDRPVIIYVTPSPQPTATVTCNPTPVVSNRPCRERG